MMRRYITALMLACCIGGYGQEKKQVTFVPPFDFPLTLSGNFGEIRSNHFHGGLDFKTGGVIGWLYFAYSRHEWFGICT